MASTLHVFRKNQKILLAVFGVLLMIAFAVTSVPTALDNMQADNNPVVATSRFGKIYASNVASLLEQRQIMRQFLYLVMVQAGTQEWIQNMERQFGEQARSLLGEQTLQMMQNRIGMQVEQRLMETIGQQTERDVVETHVQAQMAEREGLIITDEAILDYLAEQTNHAVSGQDMEIVLAGMSQGRRIPITRNFLFEALRDQLAASKYREMFLLGLQATPAERWDYYTRLKRRATAEIVALPAADILPQIKDPSSRELQKFFDDHKEELPIPGSPKPGFKVPHKASFEYFEAEYDKFYETVEVSDKDIEEHYEKNKEKRYLYSSVDEDEDEEEAKRDESPADEKPADEKPADDKSKPADDKKAGEKKADDKKPVEEKQGGDKPKADEEKTDDSAGSDSSCGDSSDSDSSSCADDSEPKADDAPKADEKAAAAVDAPTEKAKDEPKASTTDTKDAAKTDAPSNTSTDAPADSKASTDSTEPKTGLDLKGPANAPAAPAKTPPPILDRYTLPTDINTGKTPKYAPLWRVRDRIRKELAGERAVAKMDSVLQKLSNDLSKYARMRADIEHRNKQNPSAKIDPPTPPDFDASAKAAGIESGKIPLSNAYDVSRDDKLGKSRVGSESFVAAAFGSMKTYVPIRSEDTDGNRYLFWKTDDVPAHVPELAKVKDEVERAWKMIEARKDIRKKADELVAKARAAGGKSLEDTLGPEGYKVTETDAFSWLTTGIAGDFNGNVMPRLSEVDGVIDPGPDFMREVFALRVGDVGVAMNNPETIAYVVRITSLEPSEAVLRSTFMADKGGTNSESQQMQLRQTSMMDQRKVIDAWREKFTKDSKLDWLRPPADEMSGL